MMHGLRRLLFSVLACGCVSCGGTSNRADGLDGDNRPPVIYPRTPADFSGEQLLKNATFFIEQNWQPVNWTWWHCDGVILDLKKDPDDLVNYMMVRRQSKIMPGQEVDFFHSSQLVHVAPGDMLVVGALTRTRETDAAIECVYLDSSQKIISREQVQLLNGYDNRWDLTYYRTVAPQGAELLQIFMPRIVHFLKGEVDIKSPFCRRIKPLRRDDYIHD